jgi:hypothetical protein
MTPPYPETPMTAPLLRAYVDETGDRGITARSSRYFAMAGLTVADEDEHLIRDVVQRCRDVLKVPAGGALHWQDHVKKYSRRQYVTSQPAAVPGLVVNYVIFDKASIPAASQPRSDHVVFYNYVAGIMLERLLLTARGRDGGPRSLITRYGHVRGFDHAETLRYFQQKRKQGRPRVPWHLLHGEIKFVDTGSYDGLQAADQYAEMLNVALSEDEFGGYEHHHLLAIRHQIRRRSSGDAWGYGFKVMATGNHMDRYPWWPQSGI